MKKDEYKKLAKETAPRSPVLKDCLFAFLVGGAICTLGQALRDLYTMLGAETELAGTLVSCTLIFITVWLTGFGVFDRIAKHAGAGTLVPITGFANAVVSPAIDNKSEGRVAGVGTKIFSVAGPVILFGVIASAVWGVIYYFWG